MNSSRKISVVYDGECPVCTTYVSMLRLKELAGDVQLINARDDHPLVTEIKQQGISLDDGMVVKIGEQLHHGDQAVQQLALITGPSGVVNRLHYWIFSSAWRAKVIYPFLRAGRNLLLRILRRSPIDSKSN